MIIEKTLKEDWTNRNNFDDNYNYYSDTMIITTTLLLRRFWFTYLLAAQLNRRVRTRTKWIKRFATLACKCTHLEDKLETMAHKLSHRNWSSPLSLFSSSFLFPLFPLFPSLFLLRHLLLVASACMQRSNTINSTSPNDHVEEGSTPLLLLLVPSLVLLVLPLLLLLLLLLLTNHSKLSLFSSFTCKNKFWR